MNKAKKRIFLVNQTDESHKYGVGRYISEMVMETQKRESTHEMVVVIIGVKDIMKTTKSTTGNITYLNIPRPYFNKEHYLGGLTQQFSKSIFCLLADMFSITANDIFHFNSNMQYFLLREIKEYTQAKVIYTIHVSLWKVFYNNRMDFFISEWNDMSKKNQNIMNIRAEAKNCELADFVICLSQEMERDVREFYKISKHKIKIIPNGIAVSKRKFKKNEVYELNKKNEFVILYVGRFNLQKGVMELLRAFISLSSKIASITLILVGEGSTYSALVDVAKKSTAKVKFTGFVNPNEIFNYYLMADTIVFPSLNEQSSYVMLEAMKYKCPMVVTDIQPFKMLKNKHSCLKSRLIGGKIDIKNLVENMEHIVNNNKLRKKIATNAYQLFENNFTSKQMFNNTYHDLG